MSIFRVDLNFQEMKKDKEVVMAAVHRSRAIQMEISTQASAVGLPLVGLKRRNAIVSRRRHKEVVMAAVQTSRFICRMFGV